METTTAPTPDRRTLTRRTRTGPRPTSCCSPKIFESCLDPLVSEGIRLARLALSLDDNDCRALSTAGLVTAFFIGDHETAIDYSDRAVATNPNSFVAWTSRGRVYQLAGQYEEAIRSFERGIRVSPLDPVLHTNLAGIGHALIELRRFDEAVAVSRKALRQNSSDPITFRGLASALAHLGRDAEAREALARLLEIDPAYPISGRISRSGSFKLLYEGLRKAGGAGMRPRCARGKS